MSSLYVLKTKSRLYEYAQNLVKKLKEEAISWHAVGLYHLCINKHAKAKRYFSHALIPNCFLRPSYLGYAYILSLEKGHDKAIEAYMNCSRLVLGSHLPYIHVALEYMKLDGIHLAFGYFQMSLQQCNHGSFFNELAVYYYQQGMYKEARDYLHTALSLANVHQCKRSPIWKRFGQLGPYTVIHRELLHSSIIDNFKTGYVFKPDQPCLAGSFDVFKMANPIGLKQDQVAIELEQDVRYMCDHTLEHPSVLFTEDAMIVDQGDLQPRESGE